MGVRITELPTALSLSPTSTLPIVDNGETQKATLEMIKQEIIGSMYPVGSIYMSVNSADPSVYFGGTWIEWGSGRVPVGVNSNDTDFNSSEKIGGSKNLQSHTHSINASGTAASNGSHTHSFSGSGTTGYANTDHNHELSGANAKVWTYLKSGCQVNGASNALRPSSNTTYESLRNDFSSVEGHTERAGQYHTHSFSYSGTTGSNGAHTHNVSVNGTTGSKGNGNSENLQPYITCYMWKRVS